MNKLKNITLRVLLLVYILISCISIILLFIPYVIYFVITGVDFLGKYVKYLFKVEEKIINKTQK